MRDSRLGLQVMKIIGYGSSRPVSATSSEEECGSLSSSSSARRNLSQCAVSLVGSFGELSLSY
jgi:hypothetical protein